MGNAHPDKSREVLAREVLARHIPAEVQHIDGNDEAAIVAAMLEFASHQDGEIGYRRWLLDAIELIRECRLADRQAARGGSELRWDEAFHELCKFERQTKAILSPTSSGGEVDK